MASKQPPQPTRKASRVRWDKVRNSLGTIQKLKRSHTESLNESALSGTDMKEIQLMRKNFWKDKKNMRNLPEKALIEAWGTGGSWSVFGQLPSRTAFGYLCETPYNFRGLRLCPGGQDAMTLLSQSDIGVANMKGMKGEGDLTAGQDNFSVSCLGDGWEVFCVMDGHGPDGHWPSTRAVRTLPIFLRSPLICNILATGDAMRFAFQETQADLESMAAKEKVKIFLSGTTAAVALRQSKRNELWVAHVGDSKVLLLAPGHGVLRETQDHKVDIPEEYRRVTENGCQVETQEHEDDTKETRIFLEGKSYPGIMMTRSLGDLCVKPHAVCAEPEVEQWPLDDLPAGTLLLLASDGVWEFLTTQQASAIVLGELERGKTNQEAVQELLTAAKATWTENEEDYCDDITAVLLPLTAPPLPLLPAAAARSQGCWSGACSACTVQ